jgi:hypothetical protein
MPNTTIHPRPLWHSIDSPPRFPTSNRPFVSALPIVRHLSRTSRPGFPKLIRRARIYTVLRTFDITCNSPEAARVAIVRPLKSPIRLLVPCRRRSSRSEPSGASMAGQLHLGISRSASTASDRLGAALASQSVGSAARGTGVRKITNPHTLIKNGVSVRRITRAIDTQCRPKAGCADHSNPHIRIFQKQTRSAVAATVACSPQLNPQPPGLS